MLDFDLINARLKMNIVETIQQWLPAARKAGREMIVGDLGGKKGHSLSINIDTGIWKEFNGGLGGGDLISLYAAIHRLTQFDAATAIAATLGINAEIDHTKKEIDPTKKINGNGKHHTIAVPGIQVFEDDPDVVFPIPLDVFPIPAHPQFGIPHKIWEYKNADGAVLGIIARYNFPEGKQLRPLVYTKSSGWKWRAFPKPRWLFGLDELKARPKAPVLIVEGEKSRDAAALLLPKYVAVTWPGGASAVNHTDWSPLYGRKILVWPDRDKKKYPKGHILEGDEMPYEEQPGSVAAKQICDILQAHCSELKLLDVSAFTNDGWDAADCLAQGWCEVDTLMWAKGVVRDIRSNKVNRVNYVHIPKPKKATVSRVMINPKDLRSVSDVLIHKRYSGQRGPLRHYSNSWYAWNGRFYPEVEHSTIRRDVYDFLNECACTTKDHGLMDILPDKEMVNKVVDALAAECHLEGEYKAPMPLGAHAGPNPMDAINLNNGILEISTGRLWPHHPDFWTHNCVPYNFDPKAKCPIFLGFLDNAWPKDHQSIETLQEIFGYCLTSDTSLQKMFMCIGPKRSGKGTIARVLTHLVGRENTCSPTLDSLRNEFGIEQFIGKQLAVFPDVRLEGQTAAITEHLLSISGEDSKSVNRKNMKHWQGKLNTRVIMMTNLLPRFGDSSGAMASRFIILVMQVSMFGKEDTTLGMKLMDELPGIFNWAMDGLARLRARGHFVVPQSSLDKIREFEDLSAPIAAFLRENCVIGPEYSVDAQDYFTAWVAWCKDNGRDGHGTFQTFSRDLSSQIPIITSTNKKTLRGSRQFFLGIANPVELTTAQRNLIDQEKSQEPVMVPDYGDFNLVDD